MDADFDLEIYGHFSIEGALAVTDGEISFMGSSFQSVDGDGQTTDLEFNNIEIDSDDEVAFENLDGNYILNGLLTPTDGEMTIESDAGFIVNSTSATAGGRIGPIPGGFNFGGDYTVRRFIPGGTAGYRDLCSPVTGANLTDWDADLEISGPGFPDGEACGPEGCYNSCKYYQGTSFFDVTDINADLTNGEGFYIWVGDDLDTWSGGSVSVTGSLNTSADVVQTVVSNWHTIGNPYASPVLFSNVTFSGVGQYFYVYDVNIGGYQWYDNSGGGSSSIVELTDGLMATGQGIWVSGPGTITWNQACKTSNTATYIRSSGITDHFGGGFHLSLTNESTMYNCTMAFEENDNTEDGVDELIDLPHLSQGFEPGSEIAVRLGDELYRKNHIKRNFKDKSFDLYVNIKQSDIYTITAENIYSFDSYRKVYLLDKETGEMVDLKAEGSYVFSAEVGEYDRFKLILSNKEMEAPSQLANIDEFDGLNDLEITQMGHSLEIRSTQTFDSPVSISVVNILGQTEVYTISTQLTGGSNMIHLPTDLKGVHIITLSNANQTISKKLVF